MSSIQSQRSSQGSPRRLFTAGVATFAGVVLATVAVFEILQGIAAIANDRVFVKGAQYSYEFDVATWGWIHLLLGLIGLVIGIAILTEHTLGYLGGIAVAFFGAVANFAFLPHYPVWSILVISLDVLVIWALCTQLGRDRVDESFYTGPDATGHPLSDRATQTGSSAPAERVAAEVARTGDPTPSRRSAPDRPS